MSKEIIPGPKVHTSNMKNVRATYTKTKIVTVNEEGHVVEK